MNATTRFLYAISVLTTCAFAREPGAVGQAGAPMPTTTFENHAVRVVRIVLAAHEKIPMHEVTPRLVVWTTDGHLKLTFPDGRVVEQKHRAGDTEWLEAQRHAGENLGDQPIELVAVILKKE